MCISMHINTLMDIRHTDSCTDIHIHKHTRRCRQHTERPTHSKTIDTQTYTDIDRQTHTHTDNTHKHARVRGYNPVTTLSRITIINSREIVETLFQNTPYKHFTRL